MQSRTSNRFFREDVQAELRRLALHGSKVSALVQFLKEGLQLQDDCDVVVLGYLCRTFDTPLPVVLPLREFLDEDDEQEPFLRALRICFWFSAHLREEAASVEAWDHDEFRKRFTGFQAEELEFWEEQPAFTIQGYSSRQVPGSVYVRGRWQISRAKQLGAPPGDDSILADLREFASRWGRHLRQAGRTTDSHCRLGFWFDLQDQGPDYRIVAGVEAMLDHVDRAEQSAHLALPGVGVAD